ncbi:MAG: N utilization substance protein B [Candidatus Xenobia bacterium]
MKKRRQARVETLNALFMMDVGGASVEDAMVRVAEEANDPAVLNFVQAMCRGVLEYQSQIDRLIEQKAVNWKLDRLSRVDRCLLRLGIYELLHCPETPPAVVINEAVELAKVYGDEKSGAFVNGLLDSVKSSEVTSS